MNSASQLSASIEGEWAGLIRTHQHQVWRYLRSLGCTPAQADDLTQETFLRLLQSPFEQVSSRATSAYLRKTAYTRFISFCRRQSRVIDSRGIDRIDQFWAENLDNRDSDELVDHLRECLKRLTDRARQALELRYAEQASRNRIAEQLEMSEHGAKNLIQRAKKKLRECIERRERRAGSGLHS